VTRPKKQSRNDTEEDEVLEAILPTPGSSGPTQLSRALRLLASSPDTDSIVDLAGLIPYDNESDMDVDEIQDDIAPDPEDEPPKKKRRGRPPKARPQLKVKPKKATSRSRTRPSLSTVLANLPADLVTIAQQPLVRGAAFRSGGIAGNIGMVTQARRIVYEALEKGGVGGSVPDDWEEKVFGDDMEELKLGLKNAVVKVESENSKSTRVIPPFVCPSCKSAI